MTRQHLFTITSTDRVEQSDRCESLLASLEKHFRGAQTMSLSCYRAGSAIAELLIQLSDDQVFCLTIWQDVLDATPLSKEDIRVSHKEISLPDVADIFLLIFQLARRCQFQPSLCGEAETSFLLNFRKQEQADEPGH